MERKNTNRKTKNAKSKKSSFVITLILGIFFILSAWFIMYDKPLEGLENTLGRKNEILFEGISVTYIDVGQGDCSLVLCGDKSMLVDAGLDTAEDEIFRVLDSKQVNRLDCIFISHPHNDHIGCLDEILEKYRAKKLYVSYDSSNDVMAESYASLVSKARSYGAEVINVSPGDGFEFGSARVKIPAPLTADVTDLNNASAIMKLTYGDNTFLFTGDAGAEEERTVLETGENLNCDVLKVGHHGSSASSCTEFLEAVSPDICIISVGKDNDYGHPSAYTLSRLGAWTDKIYRTDLSGNITVSGDGENLTVKTSK